MAKFDPIVGRYVYVPYDGETYRIYYEENGSGIPMVCLHTAGTDGRPRGLSRRQRQERSRRPLLVCDSAGPCR